ncbi:MAG: AraC family transcriptional regulator, partial [Capsulimonas sp.]|uniref:AraC family transcriptional regulator n=1 Tax=Capsulimonas sp. TaxID=2494211 RepID=UPI00326453D2
MLGEQIHVPILCIRSSIASEHLMDRLEGTSSYIFEYFDSQVELVGEDGLREYPGNVCILYSPGQRRLYQASKSVSHTWFHVSGDGLEQCLERYAIPTNRAMVGPFESLALAPFLEEVRRHHVQREPYWEDAVTLLCRTFLRNLSRVISHGVEMAPPSLYQKETLTNLRRLRAFVHSNLRQRWTINEMASHVHMSSSHYRKTFAHYFGASPIEDLIQARVRQAKLLLRNSTMSITEIAEYCGFTSASQFHVCFRKYMGGSPGEFIKTERLAALEHGAKPAARDDEAATDLSLLYLEPVGYWRFETGEEGIDQDYHFRYGRAAFHHGAKLGVGPHGGGALRLDGALSYAEVSEPIVDTAKSFTVCAWVLIEGEDADTEWMTSVSVGNEDHCSFYLQYSVVQQCFMFTVTPSGSDYNTIHARGARKPNLRRWTHLAGVHDLERHQVTLWENGERGETLAYNTPWNAPGPTRFGASVFWGALA